MLGFHQKINPIYSKSFVLILYKIRSDYQTELRPVVLLLRQREREKKKKNVFQTELRQWCHFLLLDSFLTNLAVSSAFPSHSEPALAPYLQPIFQMSHLTFLSVCSEVWRPSAVMHFSEGPWPGARGRRQICTSAKTHRRPFLCLGLVSLQCFCCGWGCGSLSCTVCPSTREEMNLKSQVSKIQLIEKLQRFNFTSLVPVLQSVENQLRDFLFQ